MQENILNSKLPLDTSTALTNEQLLEVLQLTNANFPIGTFSHSFGLETFIRQDIMVDGPTLKKVIHSFMFGQFLHADLLGMRLVYSNYDPSLEKIWKIDNLLNCQGMSKETRKSARHIGTQMLKIYMELFPEIEDFKKYQSKIANKECYGNPAVVFALLCINKKINLENALYVHTYSTCSSLVQNCVRAIPLGQIEGQKIMQSIKREFFAELVHKALTIDPEIYFCKNNPAFEVAQMNHEEILIRLFMS